jgi:DNA invertase Pin-like site-specific DNA recombinase
MSSKIKCVIYLRVSTKSQDTSNQLQPLKEYVERMGYELVGVYEDHGVSGVKSSRPQLDQMMIDGRRRKFSMVLSWSVDRVGRDLRHLLNFCNEINELGINLYFHTQNIDTSTSIGKMFFNILGSISEFERTLIVERIKNSLENCKKKGVKLGRPSSMNDGLRNAILILKEKGVGVRETCRQLGIGTNSYYSVVKDIK